VAKKANDEPVKQFSVKFPEQLVEEIDIICSANYISRASWLLKAARELLDKERKQKSEELLHKLIREE
jgi:metal-responsive CopG/Arc/MetJ family transcriptional regulator